MLRMGAQDMRDEFAAHAAAMGEDQAIQDILSEVCEITQMGFSALARVTDTRWVACQIEDRIDFGLNPGDELQIKTTLCNDIRQSGTAIVIDHVGGDPVWRTHPTPVMYGFESYASFPLFVDGAFWGTLCAIDPAPRALSAPETIAALQGCADRIAAILAKPA